MVLKGFYTTQTWHCPFQVIKRGCSPKSSAFTFKNRCKDSISLWLIVTLLKIDHIAINSNRISKFTECKQSCLLLPYNLFTNSYYWLLWLRGRHLAGASNSISGVGVGSRRAFIGLCRVTSVGPTQVGVKSVCTADSPTIHLWCD